MANKEKGEHEFAVNGKKYLMRYTTNALCELEDLIGKPIDQILDDFKKRKNIGVKEIRKFLLAGIVEEPGNANKTIEARLNEVGDLIDELGGLAGANDIIIEAFAIAFAKNKKNEGVSAKK